MPKSTREYPRVFASKLRATQESPYRTHEKLAILKGFWFRAIAENLGGRYDSPESVFESWKQSLQLVPHARNDNIHLFLILRRYHQ